MGKRDSLRRIAQILWGVWKLYGFLTWIGVGVMSNIVSFLFYPFAQELPILLKVLYGIGLFAVFLILSVVVIRLLQLLFKPRLDTNALTPQSISGSPAGRDIIQAGRDVSINITAKDAELGNKNSPKLPSPPELHLDYLSSKFGIENDVRIITVSAWYRPTTGKMRISQVELHLIGKSIPPLDWRIIEVSQELWYGPDTKFELPIGISPGEHDAELFAFANEAWWGPYPFTVSIPVVKH